MLKIKSPTKTTKNKKFGYEPKYLDRQQEAIKERVAASEERTSNRFEGAFQSSKKRNHHRNLFVLLMMTTLVVSIFGYLQTDNRKFFNLLYLLIPLIVWYRIKLLNKNKGN